MKKLLLAGIAALLLATGTAHAHADAIDEWRVARLFVPQPPRSRHMCWASL